MYLDAYVWLGVCLEVRGQLEGVGSLITSQSGD